MNGVLDRLGAAVRKDGLLPERAGRDLVQHFCEPHVRLVGGDEGARVDELPRLGGNRIDDRRRRVTDREHADPAPEIDEGVAVHVVDQSAFGALDHDVGRTGEAGGCGCGAPSEQIAGARPRDFRLQPDVLLRFRSRGASHVLFRRQDDQHRVVVADRIVEVVRDQRTRLEADFHLRAERRIVDSAGDDAFVVLLRRQRSLDLPVAGNHSCGHLAAKAEPPDQLLPRSVEGRRDPPASIVGVDADIGAIQPGAFRVVSRQPATLNDVGKGMVDVIEIEIQPERRGGADDAIGVERDELSVCEQLDVPEVVAGLEALGGGQGREADFLEHLEGRGVLRPGSGNHDAVGKPAVIGHALLYPTLWMSVNKTRRLSKWGVGFP
jgi:hypothetical protein